MSIDCGQRILQVGNDAPSPKGDYCMDFGDSMLVVEMGASLINVMLDGCSRLATQHYLGPGPFYFFIGSSCPTADCPGDTSAPPDLLKLLPVDPSEG